MTEWANTIDWKKKAQKFAKHGYVVIPNVLEEKQALDYADQIEALLHLMLPTQDWSRPGNCSSKGIISHPSQAPHAQVVREVRYENPRVLIAFSRLWKELAPELPSDTLIGSCDRINYQHQNYCGRRQRDWWHVDQTGNDALQTIQGFVDLAGSKDSGTSTLEVMRGSHKKSQALIRPELVKKKNWYPFPAQDFPKDCPARRVRVNAGDLVLWDSRTIHQNSPNKGTHRRLVVYVCFKPALGVPNHFARKRVFETQRCTSHIPGAACIFPVKPQTYGKPLPEVVVPPEFGRVEDKGPFQDALTVNPSRLNI